MIDETNALFRENQRFRQVWIWGVVLFLAILMWYAFIVQIVLGKPWGTHPAPDMVLIIFWVLFGMGMPVLFLVLQMVTIVRTDGIHIHFFAHKTIPAGEIKTFHVRTYKPIREYGGWGIRYGLKSGMAYNMSGNRGVQLELVNGKKVLIGSQKPDELLQAIETMKQYHS